MNRLFRLAILFLLLGCLPAFGQRITMTVTVTNRAVTSNSFTANASVRVFTNVTAALTVATNLTSINATKTNLFNQIASFPFTGITLADGNTNAGSGTNSFRLFSSFGGALSGSITGAWGFVTLSTQTGPSTFTMLYPVANIVGETNRTNQASDVISALDTFATNRFGTNYNGPLSNYLNRGASPQQYVTAPVQFNATLRAAAGVALTNGFTVALTNINSVSSNHINFGNAIRSEGSGGNSLQVGSNAVALGALSTAIGNNSIAGSARSIALGNSARATNGDSIAIGTSSIAITNFTIAIGNASQSSQDADIALGYAATVTGPYAVGIGWSTVVNGAYSLGAGFSSVVSAPASVALGASASATKLYALALGYGAFASHSNSAALGPPDHLGNLVSTTATNQIVLGTASHSVYIPGVLSARAYSNITAMAGSTNIVRGSWSFPRFDLSTLAAGNNISVPFGTNRFIRCDAGPGSAATICGIIGAATTGGLDGQLVDVFNDTGFTLTFAVNTVDPVTANRINTPLGTDVSIADQAWARLTYDGTDARWKLNATYPIQASATNALATLSTNGVAVTGAWTNLNLIHSPNSVRTTNASGNVSMELRANGKLFKLGAAVTVTNTTSPTSLLTNGTDLAQIIKANTLTTNMTIRLKARGYMTSTSATMTEFGVRMNNSTLIATNLAALATSLVNDTFELECDLDVRAIGASGSVLGVGSLWYPTSSGASVAMSPRRMQNGLLQTAVTIDTTVDQVVDLYVDPGATTHGFTLTQCFVELVQ